MADATPDPLTGVDAGNPLIGVAAEPVCGTCGTQHESTVNLCERIGWLQQDLRRVCKRFDVERRERLKAEDERDSLRAEVERLRKEVAQGSPEAEPQRGLERITTTWEDGTVEIQERRVSKQPEAPPGPQVDPCDEFCPRMGGADRCAPGCAGYEPTKPDQDVANRALKQQVYTALGERLLADCRRSDGPNPELVAQFDLLGRDL